MDLPIPSASAASTTLRVSLPVGPGSGSGVREGWQRSAEVVGPFSRRASAAPWRAVARICRTEPLVRGASLAWAVSMLARLPGRWLNENLGGSAFRMFVGPSTVSQLRNGRVVKLHYAGTC